MLDDVIIGQILERERRKRKDAGWQPQPLYLPIEAPRPPAKPSEEEIDILDPQEDYDGVIEIDIRSYSQNNYKI